MTRDPATHIYTWGFPPDTGNIKLEDKMCSRCCI